MDSVSQPKGISSVTLTLHSLPSGAMRVSTLVRSTDIEAPSIPGGGSHTACGRRPQPSTQRPPEPDGATGLDSRSMML